MSRKMLTWRREEVRSIWRGMILSHNDIMDIMDRTNNKSDYIPTINTIYH